MPYFEPLITSITAYELITTWSHFQLTPTQH